MPNRLRIALCMLLFTHTLSIPSTAQCIVAPPAPACTGTEPKATDGETLGTSATKYYYGASATYNSLTLDGGTLIVCGNLTIDKLTFNTGTLYVEPGATFVIGSGTGTALQLQGGCYIYNYGTINVQRTLLLDGAHVSTSQPNIVVNASTSSVLTVAFDWLVINNPYSWFVNNGKLTTHGVVTDPQSGAGSVCLGPSSQISMSILVNNAPNTYTAPSGPGCINVLDHSYICESVTSNSNVRACLSSTHITDSSCFVSRGHVKAWGNATTFSSCTSCGSIALLPLSILSFSAEATPNTNHLAWQITGDGSTFDLQIERSSDGSHFSTLSILTPTQSTYDDAPLPGTTFYRIAYAKPEKQIFSMIKMIKRENARNLSIYPNPFTDQFTICLPTQTTPAWLELYGADGRKIKQLYIHDTGNGAINIKIGQTLPPGLYTLKVTINNQIYFRKLIRNID
ncbi:MAG: T9SS type A sorting domain-containing protein [Bacteroidetes bacterium]|nr:T9SS type A sorting domain-containing protein [Bacteroidota bacterium]